jgi:TolB-like protein/DNA-binding winged helix-turn-helix (wHTH) protein/Flp pilus assembly protein TadD
MNAHSALKAKRFYRFGPFRLNPETRVLLRAGDVVPLPPKAVETLLVLLRDAGQPVEKETLIRAVWPDAIVEENNLAHHISVLRKTLGNGDDGKSYIETIPKRGYRFVGEVKEAVEENGPSERTPPALVDVPAPARSRLSRRRLVAVTVLGVAVGALLFVWRLSRPGRSTPMFESLAVLPFQNLTGDPGQEYVSDGLTESLVGEIAKIDLIRVISRTSVMRYKNVRKPLPQISQELNAGAIIEGSVARFGNRARVTVQLLDGAKDKHLWAETYERDLGEIPTLWSEVAIAVAREIHARVDPERRAQLSARPVKREAFEAYLRGRYYWNKRTPDNINKAVEWFRKAIDEDPAYARAYGGLADCYNQLGTVLIGGQPPTEIRPQAIAAAKKALEIDPELAEAHAALAYARLYDWEWAAAESGFQHALRLNPSYASAHLWYAHSLSMRKRHDEALREVRRAQQLDPLSPIIQSQIGWILQHAGKHDEAIQELQKVLAKDPDYLWALWRIGSSYTSKSMFQEGIDALEKAAKLSGRSPSILGTLAESYGLAGRKEPALSLLREIEARSREQYVPAIAFAHAYIGLGDSERVLESLEKAYQRREQGIAWLAVWEAHGPYRSDPRFHELIRRTGLPNN